jgi:hypothetical protein
VSDVDGALDDFVRLMDAAEERYPYVSLERLRRLAGRDPAWSRLGGRTARLLRTALKAGMILSDSRTRVTRDGRLVPIQVYRLDRRNTRVAGVLGLTGSFRDVES